MFFSNARSIFPLKLHFIPSVDHWPMVGTPWARLTRPDCPGVKQNYIIHNYFWPKPQNSVTLSLAMAETQF